SAAPSAPHRPVSTELPVTPLNEGAPTKRIADAVMATRTWPPACVRADARSTSLYAAIPPETSSATRIPRSSSGTGVGSRGMNLSLALARLADDREHLGDGLVQVLVDDHVIVIARVRHLFLRDPPALGHVLVRLAAAQLLAPHELLGTRRRDEDEKRVGHCPANLLCPLDLNLEEDVVTRRAGLFDRAGRCAVEVAVVRSVLEKVAGPRQLLELLAADECVVDAIGLARACLARRV